MGGVGDFLDVSSWGQASVGHQRPPLHQRSGPCAGSAIMGTLTLRSHFTSTDSSNPACTPSLLRLTQPIP